VPPGKGRARYAAYQAGGVVDALGGPEAPSRRVHLVAQAEVVLVHQRRLQGGQHAATSSARSSTTCNQAQPSAHGRRHT